MAKQTFTTGQVLTAAQMTSLQQTALGGGATTAKTVSYVLVAADAGTVVQMNSSSSTTITVNTALFAAGDTVQIQNVGSGVCTVTAGSATVSTSATLALKQYDAGTLYFNTTSAAIFFAVDAADGMTNPMTTTGDIVYSSSGSTPARLGIGTTGQVLNVASGIPAWTTASSGMTLITRSTASAVATVTLDSIFTSTYDTYLFVIERLLNSASAALYLQLRYAGPTTEAAGYYGTSVNFASTQTQVVVIGAAQSTVASATSASQTSNFAIWFNQVGNASEGGNWHGTGQSGGLGPGAPFTYGCWQANSRTYTGLILSSASGNITGEFSVYGLAK